MSNNKQVHHIKQSFAHLHSGGRQGGEVGGGGDGEADWRGEGLPVHIHPAQGSRLKYCPGSHLAQSTVCAFFFMGSDFQPFDCDAVSQLIKLFFYNGSEGSDLNLKYFSKRVTGHLKPFSLLSNIHNCPVHVQKIKENNHFQDPLLKHKF